MRWRMLGVLFTARLAMSFQFQAVAALSGAYTDGYGIGLDGIGFLIGLYPQPRSSDRFSKRCDWRISGRKARRRPWIIADDFRGAAWAFCNVLEC